MMKRLIDRLFRQNLLDTLKRKDIEIAGAYSRLELACGDYLAEVEKTQKPAPCNLEAYRILKNAWRYNSTLRCYALPIQPAEPNRFTWKADIPVMLRYELLKSNNILIPRASSCFD